MTCGKRSDVKRREWRERKERMSIAPRDKRREWRERKERMSIAPNDKNE
jgi:hypothetical protein